MAKNISIEELKSKEAEYRDKAVYYGNLQKEATQKADSYLLILSDFDEGPSAEIHSPEEEPPKTKDVFSTKSVPLHTLLLEPLKAEERFMRMIEIAEFIADKYGGDVTEIRTALSRRTSKLKKQNKINRFGSSNKFTYWGLFSWFGPNDTPIDNFHTEESREEWKEVIRNLGPFPNGVPPREFRDTDIGDDHIPSPHWDEK